MATKGEVGAVKGKKKSKKQKLDEHKEKCKAAAKTGKPVDFIEEDDIGKVYTSLSQLTKQQREAKPKYAPVLKKWFDNGGTVSIDENGVWTYYDSEGNHVSYPDGYPDFTNAEKKPVVIQEVELDEFVDYDVDFPKADRKAKEENGKPRNKMLNTWHHHQDCKTMQEINSDFHHRFTHVGGLSITKKKKGSK